MEEALKSEEMQLHDLDAEELSSVLATLDSIFTQWAVEFTAALKDFGLALSDLCQGQISPLLIHSKHLSTVVVELQLEARNRGLHPVYNSLDQLQQTLHPWVSVDPINLSVEFDIEVPFSRELPANLYRYVAAPWITKYYYMWVEPDMTYLAFDRDHRYVTELDLSVMASCQDARGIWLCKGPMLIRQQPEESCLYNLYHQRVQGIERSCPVKVSCPKEKIIPILQNLYQLVAPKPMTIVQECLTKSEPVTSSFTGHKLLNVTPECPQAIVGARKFFHQALGHGLEQLQRVNLTEDATVWLKELLSDPQEWVLSKLLKDLEGIFSEPVPLRTLKSHVGNFIWERVKDALVYVVLTGFPLLCLSVLGLCCRRCKALISIYSTLWPCPPVTPPGPSSDSL